MASIIEELAAKTRAGGSGALPSAATSGRKSSIILELAAKSGMNINADINTLKNATATGADTAAETEQKQNIGGFFGGVGYLANKVGVGFVSSLEGGIDYITGGLAKLFGADDWAEEVMGTDWFDYSHPENWYNPSRGWQVAGDVFGGIGTSLPAIGTVAAAAAMVGASGGALTPLAQGLISAGVAGLNAAGRSTSEAYKRTGTLGGKEWAYGTLSGTTEGAVEGLSTALGLGVARLGAKLAGSAGGNAAKELIKTATFGGVLKEMGKSFIGEASEEAISEIVDPWWQRMTIDEYAPSATAKEVGYAALVGGLSGILMDGTASGIQRTGSILRGNRINGKGNTASVLDTARSISDFEGKNKTGIQDFAYISEAYNKLTDSIKSTDGKVTTMAQKKLLGDLAAANNSYNIKRFVATDAYNIVSNAEAIAENLEKFGYRTVDGKEMRYSAAELTAGYDAKKPKSIYKALETNEALRSLAVTAATGRLLIDTARTEQATLAGEALMSKADLARFLETASAEEIHGVEEAFGIEDLRTADADTLRNRIIAFAESGGIEAEMQKRQNATELAAIPAPAAGAMPTDIYMADGEAHRYTDGDLNIAISRKGDAYLIYDYNTKKLSRELSEYEVNEYLSEYRRGKEAYIAEQRAYTERQAEKAKRAELSREVRGKADAALRENIKGYATSPATLQAQLRKVYHDAVVSGISEADALSYARVSERTGLDMIFSRELCAIADGSYADGYYDPIKNRIVINPETKRAHGALLMHELTHAIYYKDGTLTIAEGIEKMPAEKKQAIMKKYTKAGITDSVTLADEMNAHYAEETLRSFDTLEKLCADKPTLKEKILSFFRGAESDYRGDTKLTKAAKQLYAQYKKLFDSFAAKGRGSNAMDLMPVRTNAYGDKKYALKDSFERLGEYSDKEISSIESTKIHKVAHSYDDIRAFVDSSLKSNTEQRLFIGKLTQSTVEKIYNATGIDVTNKSIALSSSDMKHIFNGHGNIKSEAMHGQIAITQANIENVIETIIEPDSVERRDIKNTVGILFKKSIDNRITAVTILSEKKKALTLKSAWITKEKQSTSLTSDVQASDLTPETGQRIKTVSNNSITDFAEKVNTSKEKGDGKRYALPEGESAYSYDTLTGKKDIAMTELPLHAPTTDDGKINRKAVILAGRLNARAQNNAKNTADTVFVYVPDIEADVMIRRDGLEHGLTRGDESTALATMKIGDLLKNSIAVNELNGRTKGTRTSEMSYVLLSVGQNKNSPYLVRIIADKTTNSVLDISTYGLYAVKAKKEGALFMPKGNEAFSDGNRLSPYLRSDISIADLLENVKGMPIASEVFSQDVLLRLGAERANGTLSGDVRYALPEGELDNDSILAKRPEAKPHTVPPVDARRKWKKREDVYSRADALGIVTPILEAGFLSKNTHMEISEEIFNALNTAKYDDTRREIAVSAAETMLISMMDEGNKLKGEISDAVSKSKQMHQGVRRLSLTEAEMRELMASADKKAYNGMKNRWFYNEKYAGEAPRIPLDVFVSDVANKVEGMSEMLDGLSPAQALVKINEEYGKVKKKSKDALKLIYADMTEAEQQYVVNKIANDMMYEYSNAISEIESESTEENSDIPENDGVYKSKSKQQAQKFAKEFETRINAIAANQSLYKEKLELYRKTEGLRAYIADEAWRMKERKLGIYHNMGQTKTDQFKKAMTELSAVNWRGEFNATSARKHIGELYQWYTSTEIKRGFLEYQSDAEPRLYNAEVADFMEQIASSGNGKTFTHGELSNLHKVFLYFNNLFDNYGKIYRHGRMVEALPIAEEKISIIENNRQIKRNPFTWALTNVYGQAVFKPIEVVRAIDGYENGFNTEMVLDIREASEQAAIKEMGLKREYDDFFAKNKKYAETLQNERMTYADITMPKSRLIALYMTYKREQAQAGLLYSGYKFRDTDGSYISSLPLLTQDTRKTKAEIKSMAESIAKEIESKFSATDKQYIAILERAFEAAGKLKMERDIQRMGYSNLTGGYYFPIIRADSAKSIDSAEAELDRVSNASFNKDTVKGAKQRLFIDDADAIFRRHIHAVSQYNALSPVIEAYNTLYNLDISGNPNAPKSIATEMENVWESGNRYMKKLFSDVQGIRGEMDVGNKAVNFLRGGYAKYQLGFNPKTWFKQLTSLAASTSILDWDSLSVGVVTGVSKDVDAYCPLAALRNYEDTAAMAQSVLDTAGKKARNGLDKFSNALMTPIGKVDRFVVERLFGGCQVQVAKESGGKLAIGTEANKVAAGKMLAQVIRDTQQNALATEKSAAMRSNNEIVRAFTMFTADGVAVMSKMLGTYGEYWTLREKLKTATDANVRTELTARLKTVGKAARKSTMALISTAIFGAGVDFFFRWLYNKLEDKPEDEVKNFAGNTMMGMIGGLPIIKDIVSKAFEGYDIKNYTYSAMNDMISSLTELVGTTKDWLSDKDNEQARNKALKNFAYSMGQVFGMPVRNVYNFVYGLTKRIVPSAAYEWDTHFYTKTYGSDFSAALEKDDTDTASFILSLMTKNEVGGELDEKVRSEFVALAKSGNKVLPKSVSDSITVDGTAYKFTRSEKEAIRAEYASVNATVKKLVYNVRYRIMDESTRAYALKYVYNAHLEKAYSEVLYGGARDAEMIAADLIGIDMMAIAKAIKKSVQGDTDDDGKAISGSKRQNIIARIRVLPMTSEEKLLLIAMLGYKIQAGDIGGMDESRAKKKLLSYIFAQRLTADEKAALCIKCGFEVKNGRVSTKNL